MSALDEWRTDPFRFAGFKIAVGTLLNAIAPKGEIKSPVSAEMVDKFVDEEGPFFDNPALVDLLKQKWKSPENLAADVFSNLWAQLNRSHPLSEKEKLIMQRGAWVGEMMIEETYALAEARADLGLDKGGEKQ